MFVLRVHVQVELFVPHDVGLAVLALHAIGANVEQDVARLHVLDYDLAVVAHGAQGVGSQPQRHEVAALDGCTCTRYKSN